MKMELNLMRSIYGKESAAPRGACLTGILRSRGCAPRYGASPRAIAPSAPPAPNINVETQGTAQKSRPHYVLRNFRVSASAPLRMKDRSDQCVCFRRSLHVLKDSNL
jgi:hypothetical protein